MHVVSWAAKQIISGNLGGIQIKYNLLGSMDENIALVHHLAVSEMICHHA